jgi:hypothetical protein
MAGKVSQQAAIREALEKLKAPTRGDVQRYCQKQYGITPHAFYIGQTSHNIAVQ